MKTIENIEALSTHISALKAAGKSIGFVPTMGALHQGHLSLIQAARASCDIVVCSIFVNPTQFNEASDFDHYPRTLAVDAPLLAAEKCDILFAPAVKEIYPEPDLTTYTFGALDHVMEGAQREGHFNGVGMVVRRLFEIVQPHQAFFGEKDWQQLMVVKQLVKQYNLDVEVIGCPIVREADGLAMSSRNQRLSAEERQQALALYATLNAVKDRTETTTIAALKAWGSEQLHASEGVTLDYFEIAQGDTLEAATDWQENRPIVAFVAAFVGPVRLIDNLVLFP